MRFLQENEEANCNKVEPNDEEFNKYYCTVQAKTSNIDDININLSTNFKFKPSTTFESFYISSLANMNLINFTNINSKEYISSEIFILDNSTIYKYNNTNFEVKGIIEKSNPNFKKTAQLLIENNNNKFKKVNCSLLNEKSNNYNLICLTNEKLNFSLQGSVIFSGDNLILINLENEDKKLNINDTEEYKEPNQNYYSKKKKSSKKWIIVVIIVPIVVLLIVIAVIVFVVRKKRNPPIEQQSTTQINLNQLN